MQERIRFEHEISHLAERELFHDPDNRRRVLLGDNMTVPHRWICRLTAPDSDPREQGYGLGTGVLVGPRHVLTAAHVLVSDTDPGKTVGDRLRVQLGVNGTDKRFGAVGVLGWQVNPDWILRDRKRWVMSPENDYALVTLKENVSAWRDPGLGGCTLSFWGAPDRCGHGSEVGFEPNMVTGQEVRVTGYPGDKPRGTLWSSTGPMTYEPTRGRLRHRADTKGGQSGSPIWLMRGGRACLAGIHSGGNGAYAGTDGGASMTLTHNGGVLLTGAVVRKIESWKTTYRQ